MIQDTPMKFIVKTNHTYPPFNNMIFEEFFYNYITNNDVTNRVYLPILWTNFYLSRGNAEYDMSDLQYFLDSLDKTKKYFTILQYDDGILQNIDHLDIIVYGAGGGGKKNVPRKNLGIEIPLICKPNPNIKIRNKDILAGFVGALNGRHEVRDIMVKELLGQSGFFISNSLSYDGFSEVMERNVFSLCPRGYGSTSFRICESLQYGSIPVYIFDNPWIPWKNEFNFEDIGILIDKDNIKNIPDILKSKTDLDINRYLDNGKRIYKEYFDYTGCAKKIIEICDR